MTHGLEFPAPADELVQPAGAAYPMSRIEMARRPPTDQVAAVDPAPPDPEVVAAPRRRQFTAEYRLRILDVHISRRAAWTEHRDGKNP